MNTYKIKWRGICYKDSEVSADYFDIKEGFMYFFDKERNLCTFAVASRTVDEVLLLED
jgi:hypothetical protein